MRSARAALLFALCVLLLAGAVPATAGASSLLSGYGGPGQGNQEILGSTLLGGSSGGGGTAGGGEGASIIATTPNAGGSSPASTSPAGARTRSKAAKHPPTAANAGHGSKAHGRSTPAPAVSSAVTLTQASDVGSQALGLDGADALYILLALGVLSLTGALTGRLTRRSR